MFHVLQKLISPWPHPKHVPARARTWLACSLTSCVILALSASTVSCMAFILTRRLLFSVWSIAFSWNMSLMLSMPSNLQLTTAIRNWPPIAPFVTHCMSLDWSGLPTARWAHCLQEAQMLQRLEACSPIFFKIIFKRRCYLNGRNLKMCISVLAFVSTTNCYLSLSAKQSW